jgi:hypothetical protein
MFTLWGTDPLLRSQVDRETIRGLSVLQFEPADEKAITREAAM